MNARSYKTVFSKRLGILVAVGEHVSGQGKANGASSSVSLIGTGSACFVGALTASFALVGMAWAQPAANALPSGGQVAQGAATISQSGSVLNINQSTAKAVLNWQSFDIGKNATVNIQQPNASAVMLNRVSSANPSQIFGQLNANGQVVLINPNGVLFGKDGSVNANSFTASTLGLTDANFMAGKYKFEANGASGSVVNQGSIQANGGYVALVGASVSNEGQIETKGGNVFLAAGNAVTVPVSPTGRIKLELSPAAINAAVANSQTGTIVTEGGMVFMQASALNTAVASIIQSGSINTSAPQAGGVHLLADGGSIKVDGRIVANSQGTKGGDIVIGRDVETGVLARRTNVTGAVLESQGGFVETSGDWLATNGVVVKAKDWLLDPTDINIVAIGTATPDTPSNTATGTTTYQETSGVSTSEVLKSTIESAINSGTNVTITTANPTAGANGAGNITISTALSFSNTGTTNATLTLLAKNGITQNAGASITTNAATSTKLVNVVMTAEGAYMGVSTANANSRGITLGSTISTNGDVTLSGTNNNTGSGAGVSFSNTAGIKANTVKVTGVKLGTAAFGYGVSFNGINSIESTGATASVINGTSLSQSTAYTYGTTINDGANVTFKSASNGTLVVKGSNAAWETGLRISGGFNASTKVTTDGNITLGALEDKSQFSFRSGTIVANSGSLKIYGQMSGGGTAISTFDGASITGNNGASIEITGVATGSATAVGLGQNTPVSISTIGGGDIKISGTTATGSNAVATSASTIDSSGMLTITAAATAGTGSGLNISSPSASLKASGNLSVTGSSIGNIGVTSYGSLTSTNGSIAVTGSSSNSRAVDLHGVISAKSSVDLQASNIASGNSFSAVYLDQAITATNGQIAVKASTAGTTSNALQMALGATLNAGTDINIKADSVSLDVSASTPTVTAGSAGTVNITTDSAAAKINIGSSDAGSATASSRTLGLSNAELNRISAGNLVIGTTSHSGGIVVSANTTTNAATGNVTLQSGGSVQVSGVLTVGDAAATKNLVITGTGAGGNTGVAVSKDIKAATMDITGQSASGHGVNVLGAALTAGGSINITGTTGDNADLGVIIWQGSAVTSNGSNAYVDGANAISIRGLTSTGNVGTGGRNVVINDATITNNSNNGNTYIYAQNSKIALDQKSVITNAISAGSVQIVADNNAVIGTSQGSGATPTAQITQNSSKGVAITSKGTGDVQLGKVINNGIGDVVVGAGTSRLAGDGTGGQVTTHADSAITQNSTGGTYIYSGNASDTGALAGVGGFANGLFLSTVGSDTENAASNTAYATGGTRNSIAGGAKAQLMLREKVALSGDLNNAVLTYGGATDSASIKTAMQTANPAAGTTNVLSTTSNAGTFKILKADVVADMEAGKPTLTNTLANASNLSGSGNLKVNTSGYQAEVAGTNYNQAGVIAKVVVSKRNLVVSASASSKVYDGTNAASVSLGSDKVTGDLLTLASTSSSFSGPEVGANKVVTVNGISVNGSDSGNYLLFNAVATTTAAITAKPATAPTPNALQPVINPGAPGGQRLVVVDRSVNAAPITVAAANVLLDTEPSASLSKAPREKIIRRNECSILNPENCECEQTAIPAIEVCYVPVAGRVKVLGNQN